MSGGSLRLGSGVYCGRRIRVGRGLRPTEGRVRKALFSIWRECLPGSLFLDLFAGSGAVGLEALGLGAGEIWLLESERRALSTLEQNCRLLDPEGRGWRIVVARLPEELDTKLPAGLLFDLVFADPPYRFRRHGELLERAGRRLRAGGELALEHPRRSDPPRLVAGLALSRRRSYGETALSFYRPAGEERA